MTVDCHVNIFTTSLGSSLLQCTKGTPTQPQGNRTTQSICRDRAKPVICKPTLATQSTLKRANQNAVRLKYKPEHVRLTAQFSLSMHNFQSNLVIWYFKGTAIRLNYASQLTTVRKHTYGGYHAGQCPIDDEEIPRKTSYRKYRPPQSMTRAHLAHQDTSRLPPARS